MAELTVIVPLYNMEKHIEQCILSILNQSYVDINIIIVDDGSTDNSLCLCEEIAETDNRVQIIHQENQGLAGARYTGLKATKTKYVTFVDADDFILTDAYEKAVKYMHQNIDMILFQISRYFSDGRVNVEEHVVQAGYYNEKKLKRDIFSNAIWNFDKNTPGIECSLCVRLVKTELLINQYKQMNHMNIYYGEDAAITYPLYLSIKDMQIINHCYYCHRQRETICASYIENINYFDKLYELYRYLKNAFSFCENNSIWLKQLNYYYIYSTEQKKRVYLDYHTNRNDIFPFGKFERNQKIVLYGAGEIGNIFYNQLIKSNYCEEILWVDRYYFNKKDDRIKRPELITSYKYDFIFIAIDNRNICRDVKEYLIGLGVQAEKIYY